MTGRFFQYSLLCILVGLLIELEGRSAFGDLIIDNADDVVATWTPITAPAISANVTAEGEGKNGIGRARMLVYNTDTNNRAADFKITDTIAGNRFAFVNGSIEFDYKTLGVGSGGTWTSTNGFPRYLSLKIYGPNGQYIAYDINVWSSSAGSLGWDLDQEWHTVKLKIVNGLPSREGSQFDGVEATTATLPSATGGGGLTSANFPNFWADIQYIVISPFTHLDPDPGAAVLIDNLRLVSEGAYTFPKGTYNITSNLTFNDPVYFEDGALLNISSGATVTFTSNTFSESTGQVFTGNGKVNGLKKLMPEWFGAIGDGITDDTQAIQKALNCCEDGGFSAGTGNVVLLRNSYLVDSLTVNSSFVTIDSENAWLIAKDTGSYPYLLKFTRNFGRIVGTLFIEGNYNLDYECMIQINARHFIAHNVTIWRASLGWLFGNRSWATSGIPGDAEKGDSEIEIIGGATVHCLRGVEAVGANTIVTFSNALIYSYPWTLPEEDPRKAAWESADSTLVRCIGSLVYFTGGGLANFSSKIPLIEVQPIRCTKPQYFSNYGGVYIANAHIESGNLFATANPNQIPTQDSKGNPVVQEMKSLILTSCGGYLTGNNVLINTDPMFTGGIVVKNCNFYGINRTAAVASIANPLAFVDIDMNSFGGYQESSTASCIFPGDANGDGSVDVGDLGILAANYGMSEGATLNHGDFNADEKVDVGDLGILAAAYGTHAGDTDWEARSFETFGQGVSKEDGEKIEGLLCGGLGMPVIALLALMGLMFIKPQV